MTKPDDNKFTDYHKNRRGESVCLHELTDQINAEYPNLHLNRLIVNDILNMYEGRLPYPKIVYLSGMIAGCTEEEKNGWRDEFTKLWPQVRNPMHRPFNEHGTEADMVAIVEGDKKDIDESDILFVYYTGVPSAGTMMEIMYAYEKKKPVWVLPLSPHPLSPWIRYHAARIFNYRQDLRDVTLELATP